MGIFELDDLSALGADHVVVMLPQMPMFISGLAIVESILLCKTVAAHQIDGVRHKFGGQSMTVSIDQFGQIFGGHMVFGSQKNVKNGQAVIEAINAILFEQLYKLLFFLLMDGMRSHYVPPRYRLI
jgi:hypothetical protein